MLMMRPKQLLFSSIFGTMLLLWIIMEFLQIVAKSGTQFAFGKTIRRKAIYVTSIGFALWQARINEWKKELLAHLELGLLPFTKSQIIQN